MFSLREYRGPTHRLPDLLPWAALVDEGVVLQKDGLLQKTLAFRGPDLASSSLSELVSGIARLNNALRRFGSGWPLFIEAQRHSASHYPRSSWPNLASWIVDVERRDGFQQAGARYESSYYLTFVWNPPTATATRAEALFYQDPDTGKPNDRALDLIAQFRKEVIELAGIMAGVFPEVRELDDNETLIVAVKNPNATASSPRRVRDSGSRRYQRSSELKIHGPSTSISRARNRC
jgi:type IV secretion system protein VirB4